MTAAGYASQGNKKRMENGDKCGATVDPTEAPFTCTRVYEIFEIRYRFVSANFSECSST